MANIPGSVLPSRAPGAIAPSRSAAVAVPHPLSRLTLAFALLSIVFFLLLVFLRIPFPLNPLMSWQDALDVLTPLVLIPVYWLMFQLTRGSERDRAGEIVFMVFSAFWVLGQGMHLSANSIDNLIGNLAKSQVIDVGGTDIYRLTYFYDETLSHYLWHIGVLGLAVLLMYEGWRHATGEKTNWPVVAPAGVLYGINCFFIFTEGLTTPLSFPVAALAGLIPLLFGRVKLSRQPVLAFFTIAFLFAFVTIGLWSLYTGGFPPAEPMDYLF